MALGADVGQEMRGIAEVGSLGTNEAVEQLSRHNDGAFCGVRQLECRETALMDSSCRLHCTNTNATRVPSPATKKLRSSAEDEGAKRREKGCSEDDGSSRREGVSRLSCKHRRDDVGSSMGEHCQR